MKKKRTTASRGFLLIYGADPDAWARRHGLEPFSHPCGECGAELRTTIPFVVRSERAVMRGLTAPECACGNKRPPYCIVGLPSARTK